MDPPSLDSRTFSPTAESIPPNNCRFHLKLRNNDSVPVYRHVQNPLGFLLRSALIYPNKVAVSHFDTPYPVTYTYSVWAQRVQNLAYALISAGIQPGDRVAVISPNTPLMADAYQGVIAARAIVTPINIRLKKHEVSYILVSIEHSECKLILIDHEYLQLIDGINTPRIVSNDTGRQRDPYENFLSKGRRYSREKGWPGLDAEIDEEAPAVLTYTSGTTGRPKGVLTTLRGTYMCAIGNVMEAEMRSNSTYLWILPMFHTAGWSIPWAITFASASQITMRSVDYTAIWKHLMNSGVTHYCAAPTVQVNISNHPSAQPVPKKISTMVGGSAPTTRLLESLEKLGIDVIHIYGLTEVASKLWLLFDSFSRTFEQTYGPYTTRKLEGVPPEDSNLDARSKYMAKQGHATAIADFVRVVYQTSEDCDATAELIDVPWDGKTIGEVVMRGNLVMKEYFKNPEATKKAFRGGFFHSGDLAVIYPDGSISIVDRCKDIIISGGENASSLAIEQALASHPAVLEVSVVARSHPKWGERPIAFIILRDIDSSVWGGREVDFEKQLIQFAKTRLPGFACPEWVQVVKELPKNGTGKVLKVELRKVAAKL